MLISVTAAEQREQMDTAAERDRLKVTVAELVAASFAICAAWESTEEAMGEGSLDSYAPNGWSEYHKLTAAIERAKKGE